MVVFMKNMKSLFSPTRRYGAESVGSPFFGSIYCRLFSPNSRVWFYSARLQPRFVFPFSVVCSTVIRHLWSREVVRLKHRRTPWSSVVWPVWAWRLGLKTQRLFPRIVSATSFYAGPCVDNQWRAEGVFYAAPSIAQIILGSDDENSAMSARLYLRFTICSFVHVGFLSYLRFLLSKIYCLHTPLLNHT